MTLLAFTVPHVFPESLLVREGHRGHNTGSLSHTHKFLYTHSSTVYLYKLSFQRDTSLFAHKEIRFKAERSCIVAITEQLHTLIYPLVFLLLFQVFLLPKTPFITAFLWLKYIFHFLLSCNKKRTFYLVFSWTTANVELFEMGFRQSNKLSWLQKKTPSLLVFCCWQEACIKSAFHVVSVGIKPFTLTLLVPCCVTFLQFFFLWLDCWQSKSCLSCLYCHVWRLLQCVCGRLSFQTSYLTNRSLSALIISQHISCASQHPTFPFSAIAVMQQKIISPQIMILKWKWSLLTIRPKQRLWIMLCL